MKILFIINSCYMSGSEISAIHLLRSLDRNRYTVYILLPEQHIFPTAEIGQAQIFTLPLRWFFSSKNPFCLAGSLYHVICCTLKICRIIRKESIDVVYSNTIKSHIYSAFIKIFKHQTVIWHVRDVSGGELVRKLLAHLSDKVICVSRFVYESMPLVSKKKTIIYNGVDTSFFNRTQLSEIPSRLCITKVCQLTPWKNVQDFIQLALLARVHRLNATFLIAGDNLSLADKKYKDRIVNMISENNLEGYVTLLGWVTDIRQVYVNTDILIHTSINEPFGRVVAEAMAMEVPVIAYRSGGPAEIIEDGKSGILIDPGDYHAMFLKLEILSSCETTRRRIGAEGRKRIKRHFELSYSVSAIEGVLEALHA